MSGHIDTVQHVSIVFGQHWSIEAFEELNHFKQSASCKFFDFQQTVNVFTGGIPIKMFAAAVRHFAHHLLL